jgi:hypothetical protein
VPLSAKKTQTYNANGSISPAADRRAIHPALRTKSQLWPDGASAEGAFPRGY